MLVTLAVADSSQSEKLLKDARLGMVILQQLIILVLYMCKMLMMLGMWLCFCFVIYYILEDCPLSLEAKERDIFWLHLSTLQLKENGQRCKQMGKKA